MRYRWLINIGISLAILAALFYWLPLDELSNAIVSVPFTTWLMVLLLFVIGHIASAFKWRLIMFGSGVSAGRMITVKAHFIGLFANIFLPSIVGGDVLRVTHVARSKRGETAAIALASITDRLNDVLALVIIAGIAAFLMSGGDYQVPTEILATIAVLLLLGCLALILVVRFLPLERVPGPLRGVFEKLSDAMTSFLRKPSIAVAGLTLSVLIQSGFVGLNIVIARAMAIDAAVVVWMFAWPMAKLIALAPVSFGGIGVREVALAGVLAPFGVEASLAVAQSLSWEVVLLLTGLISGLLFVVPGSTRVLTE